MSKAKVHTEYVKTKRKPKVVAREVKAHSWADVESLLAKPR